MIKSIAGSTAVVRVLVSGPGDTHDYRPIVDEATAHWNAILGPLTNVIFVPVKWDRHGVSQLALDPQAAVNAQIVEHVDAVLALFNGRLGTKTPRSESGTVEEIEYARDNGLRCSVIDVSRLSRAPQDITLTDWLEESRKSDLLIQPESPSEFEAQLQRTLGYWAAMTLRDLARPKATRVRANFGWVYPPPSPNGTNVETVRFMTIENFGEGTAREVEFKILDAEQREVEGIFVSPDPLELLTSGASVSIRMILTMGNADGRQIRLRWFDEDGQHESISSMRMI